MAGLERCGELAEDDIEHRQRTARAARSGTNCAAVHFGRAFLWRDAGAGLCGPVSQRRRGPGFGGPAVTYRMAQRITGAYANAPLRSKAFKTRSVAGAYWRSAGGACVAHLWRPARSTME